MKRAKTDRRILKTKRAIICALLKLQKMNHFDKITVTSLTDTADINRKTFYLHYKSVEDVCEKFEERLAERVDELIHESQSQETGLSAETLFKKLQEQIDQYQDIFRALFVPDILPVYVNHIQSKLVESVTNSLRETHSCPEVKLHSRSVFCIAGVVSMYLAWACNPNSQSPSSLTEELTALSVLSFKDIRNN